MNKSQRRKMVRDGSILVACASLGVATVAIDADEIYLPSCYRVASVTGGTCGAVYPPPTVLPGRKTCHDCTGPWTCVSSIQENDILTYTFLDVEGGHPGKTNEVQLDPPSRCYIAGALCLADGLCQDNTIKLKCGSEGNPALWIKSYERSWWLAGSDCFGGFPG